MVETLLYIEHLKHFLLLLKLERQVRCNGVGKATGLFYARKRSQYLGWNFLIQFDVLVELRD